MRENKRNERKGGRKERGRERERNRVRMGGKEKER